MTTDSRFDWLDSRWWRWCNVVVDLLGAAAFVAFGVYFVVLSEPAAEFALLVLALTSTGAVLFLLSAALWFFRPRILRSITRRRTADTVR